jgi:8-oxo-dGTP pyrophosphatase MutT (NUDIX family)
VSTDTEVARRFAHLHADAVDVLECWPAPDPGQDALRQQYLEHLRRHADGVAKAGPPVHLTASCLVLSADGEHAMLTHHRRAGRWFQFGGHLEATDSCLWAAARREAREESGVADLDPLPRPVHLDRHELVGDFGPCREHLDVRYAALAPAGARPQVSGESLDVRWWPVDELPEATRAELTPLVSLAHRVLGHR